MSDNEEGGKKSGYRLEYASSARAKCKGPKPCAGTVIGKGELRMGSLVDFRGNSSFAWRHWGCVTAKIISNMKKSFEAADELDGFEDLNEDDQGKIRKAWEVGHVADEDIPETARKPAGEEDADEDEEKPKKKAAGKAAKKDTSDEPGVFKFEYAAAGRAKCKGCGEGIGKDFFRIGHEIEFRGKSSFQFMHWGCLPSDMVAKLKKSYSEPSEVEGFSDLKDAEKEKVQRGWEEGEIPEDDKGPGEAVETGKKKAAPRKKKDDDGEPPKKRARKVVKKNETEDEDEEEEEEKPKRKRAAPKKAAEKKAPAKKRATKKKEEDDESGEDFGAELDAVSGDEEGEEEQEDSDSKKRKRAPAKAKASSSKPASKRATKPASRAKKQVAAEESDDE